MRNKFSLSDKIRVRLVAVDIHSALNVFSQQGIMIQDVSLVDEITADFTISLRDYSRVDKQKYDIKILTVHGLLSYIKRIRKRVVLLIGVACIIFLSVYIQNHILFIDVSGNNNVAERYIIETAQDSGLTFGCERKALRSEYIKNILLQSIPELQWVGINTAGCVATIQVRERSSVQSQDKDIYFPSSIVASKDGVVSDFNITSGTPNCRVGDSVTKGQVLISGVSSMGKLLSLTRASGEVYAQTEHEFKLITMPPTLKRVQITGEKRYYRIIFRKNIINLCKYSGILDSTCVKISSKYTLSMPSSYKLPITLWCETVKHYNVAQPIFEQGDLDWLLEQGADYMLSQMIAGQITSFTYNYIPNQAGVSVNYVCKEMIGQTRKEELFYTNGKNS